MAAAETDKEVVGIIITGAGRAFCAGADMGDLQTIASEQKIERKENAELAAANPGDPEAGEGYRQPFSYFASVRKPIIAAINGPCVGLAVPISIFCDLRFVSEEAFFMTAFIQRGLIAEWGISWMLPRLVGVDNALDMILSSRRVYAEEALRIGLASRVIPGDELLAKAKEYIKMLADRSSPGAMAISKRQVYQDIMLPLDESLSTSYNLMRESFQCPDFKEGVQSFVEKRPPAFKRI